MILVSWLVKDPRFTAFAAALLALAVGWMAFSTGVVRHPLDPIGSSPVRDPATGLPRTADPDCRAMALVAWRLSWEPAVKLASVEEMRRIEQLTDAAGHSYAKMMEMAGRAVANAVVQQSRRGPATAHSSWSGQGNNGGDGLVAAHYLLEAGCDVSLYLWKRNFETDANYRRLADGGCRCRDGVGRAGRRLSRLRGELAGNAGRWSTPSSAPGRRGRSRATCRHPGRRGSEVARRKRRTAGSAPPGRSACAFPLPKRRVLQPATPACRRSPHRLSYVAVDCPTGLNCDTGALDPAAVAADLTVTFAYPKWGHPQHPGAGACGAWPWSDIGVPADLDDSLPVELVGAEAAAAWLPARPADANKGTFGKVLIAGRLVALHGRAGAQRARRSASGAGHVTVALPARSSRFSRPGCSA